MAEIPQSVCNSPQVTKYKYSSPQTVKNSMIFKTFNSDIDKISAKWGIFGRSFNDFIEASKKRKIMIDDLFTINGVSLKNAKKQAGSFWSYLYPKKEDIESQLIDVDSLIPKIDKDNFDFDKWINELNDTDKQVKAGTKSWQDYSNKLDKNQQWIAKWGQETEGQIRTQNDLVKANQQARASAPAHNEALKAQTLGAKAGKLALSALATVGNMLAMWVISEVVSAIYSCVTASDRLKESAKELGSQFSSTQSDISDYKKTLYRLH